MIVRRSSAHERRQMDAPASPTMQILRGLWASSDNNVYAVGDAGTILCSMARRGARSLQHHHQPARGLGSSFNNIYAVGGGTVLHYLP